MPSNHTARTRSNKAGLMSLRSSLKGGMAVDAVELAEMEFVSVDMRLLGLLEVKKTRDCEKGILKEHIKSATRY